VASQPNRCSAAGSVSSSPIEGSSKSTKRVVEWATFIAERQPGAYEWSGSLAFWGAASPMSTIEAALRPTMASAEAQRRCRGAEGPAPPRGWPTSAIDETSDYAS
jgi:hypothetical protein